MERHRGVGAASWRNAGTGGAAYNITGTGSVTIRPMIQQLLRVCLKLRFAKLFLRRP